MVYRHVPSLIIFRHPSQNPLPLSPFQEDNPGLIMYGMTCVIASVGMWLLLASYLEMPVSTTHSCVGGIIGMAMMSRGSECVVWYEESEDFPYVKGVSAM